MKSNLVKTLPGLKGTSEEYDQIFNTLILPDDVSQGETVECHVQLDQAKTTITRIITLLNQEDPHNELSSSIASLFRSISPNQLVFHASFAPLWEAFIACFHSRDLKKQRALVKGLFTWREQGVNAEIILQYLHTALYTVIPYCPVRFLIQMK